MSKPKTGILITKGNEHPEENVTWAKQDGSASLTTSERLLTEKENPYNLAKLVDASRLMFCLPNGVVMEGMAIKMCQQAFREGAKAQLAKDLKFEQARVEGIFEDIENKAHHIDLIDTIRINLDWLDWQALKKREGVK